MRIYIAETIGTFSIIFIGIAAIATGQSTLAIALAFGFAVMVMIAAVGSISNAHFNPAVSLAFYLIGHIKLKQLFIYLSAELSGAILALLLLKSLLGAGSLKAVKYGATLIHPTISTLQAFTIEAILTFFLMFIIVSMVLSKNPLAGLYIGLGVSMGAIAGGAATGASMNPARSFAPALFSGLWSQHWLYWLAPSLGAYVGALTARYIWQKPKASPKILSPQEYT